MPKVDPFPQPFKSGSGRLGRNFWSYSDVVDWIDRRAGRPPRKHDATDAVRLIGSTEVRHLLGGVSEMYVWRLLHHQSNKKQRKGAA
jgi:hypothetical protein